MVGLRGLEAAALVDRDVHEHRAAASCDVASSRVTSFGALAPGTSTAPITTSAANTSSSIASMVEKRVRTRPWNMFVELAQPRQRAVEDRDFGAEACRHRAAWVPTTPPPITTTRAGGNARHAADQHAACHRRRFRGVPAASIAKPARHLAHRRQQRQAALGIGDGLIGDRRAARGHQTLGLLRIRRQMQIGEEIWPSRSWPIRPAAAP